MSSLSKPLSISLAQTISTHDILDFFVHILYISVHAPTAFRYTKAQIKHPHLHPTKYSLKACVFPVLLNLFTQARQSTYVTNGAYVRWLNSEVQELSFLCGFIAFHCLLESNIWNWKLRQTGAEAGIGSRLEGC